MWYNLITHYNLWIRFVLICSICFLDCVQYVSYSVRSYNIWSWEGTNGRNAEAATKTGKCTTWVFLLRNMSGILLPQILIIFQFFKMKDHNFLLQLYLNIITKLYCFPLRSCLDPVLHYLEVDILVWEWHHHLLVNT